MKATARQRLDALETARHAPDKLAAVEAALRAKLDDPALSDHRKAVVRAVLAGDQYATD